MIFVGWGVCAEKREKREREKRELFSEREREEKKKKIEKKISVSLSCCFFEKNVITSTTQHARTLFLFSRSVFPILSSFFSFKKKKKNIMSKKKNG